MARSERLIKVGCDQRSWLPEYGENPSEDFVPPSLAPRVSRVIRRCEAGVTMYLLGKSPMGRARLEKMDSESEPSSEPL